MTSIANGESGLSVRTKLNAALAVTDAVSFATRAAFVSANTTTPGLGLTDGQVAVAGGYEYRRLAASSAIADLVGWIPNGDVTPQHFGAVGNGVADDTTAAQAAVNYVSSVGGGVVKIPAGTYLISARVNMFDGVTLRGELGGASILKPTAANASTNGHLVGAGAGVNNIALENLVLDGNASSILVARPLTQFFSVTDIIIDNCIFKNTRHIAINLSTNIQRLKITNCVFQDIAFLNGSGGTGARQAIACSGGGFQNISITDNLFLRSGLDCISLYDVSDFVVSRNIAREGYTLIYVVPGLYSERGVISDNVVTAVVNAAGSLDDSGNPRPQPHGIDLPYIADCTVSGNIVTDCANGGMIIARAAGRVTITGNVCSRNYQAGGLVTAEAGIGVLSFIGAPQSAEILIDGNICTDDQGVKTQEYGLVISNVETATVTTSNIFSGNKTADVAYKTRSSASDVGTLVRTENPVNPGPLHPGYRSGSVWYAPPFVTYATSPVAQTTDTIYVIPLLILGEVLIDALGTFIHTGVASTQARLGLYANNTAALPGVKLAEGSTTVSGVSAVGVTTTLAQSVLLKPGRYWLAAICDGAISMKTISPTHSGISAVGSTAISNVTNGLHVTGMSAASTFSSGLPADLSSVTWTQITNASAPVIAYRV